MKETERQTIVNAVSELKSLNGSRQSKYLRNYGWYNYTATASLDSIRSPQTVGLWERNRNNGSEDDVSNTPQINVIKSCIDTLTAKIAQSKVRPFFNCINGGFKDIQVVKQAQQFFDVYFDTQNVNKVVSEAFRDSCIFDTGVIYINEETKQISKVLPWQIYVRPAEKTYGKLTRVYYEQKDYPVSLLGDLYDKYTKGKDYVTLGTYYDTVKHKKSILVDNSVVEIKDYEGKNIPFCFLYYTAPVYGVSSQSIVDMLRSNQMEIDSLLQKISTASQLSDSLTYFVPENSSIKTTQLNNRIGNVVTYKPFQGMTGSPVTVSTHPFIDPQFMETVEVLVQKSYEMVGISQLSAMSTKPNGLDSGVALSTMENVEGDRFETQLNQVIRCYVDIAKICLEVFPKNEDILPEDSKRVSLKWKDIVGESDRMTIQFSAADSLSKDPSEKLKQLKELASSGIIPQTRIAQFMELPDLQAGYSLSNNAVNAVLTIISNCIEKDSFDVPDYIPFPMLKEEIINTQLSLEAANGDKNKDDIDKLSKLYEIVEDKEKQWTSEAAMQQQQGQGQSAGGGNGGEEPLPQTTNVLTQEAGMTQTDGSTADMDVSTPSNTNGSWNGDYNSTNTNN